jgi:biotin carboxyl carrier protein
MVNVRQNEINDIIWRIKMKRFNITVNGKLYAVEVEEMDGNQQTFASVSAPIVPTQQPVIETPLSQKLPHPEPTRVISGGLMVAPMPGTILDIKVSEGQTVKAGDVVVILEAMKMENELVAPINGTVEMIYTGKGELVNAGDSILTID